MGVEVLTKLRTQIAEALSELEQGNYSLAQEVLYNVLDETLSYDEIASPPPTIRELNECDRHTN